MQPLRVRRIPQRSDLCLPPATGAGAQPQRGYRHHRGALKRQLYGQPYMRTDLIKSVRILQLSSRGARWGRSAAYESAAPAAIAKEATIIAVTAEGKIRTVRKGTNSFTCMADNPATPGP